MARKMATLERAEELLEDIRSRARGAAEKELKEVRAFAKQAGAAEAEDLQLWDTGFWSERLREAKYDLREEELRPYFQLPAVIEGMFGLASDLFGVTVVRQYKLDPKLESTRFQTSITKKDNSAFNLNLVSELAPLHCGESRWRVRSVAQGCELLPGARRRDGRAARVLLPGPVHAVRRCRLNTSG